MTYSDPLMLDILDLWIFEMLDIPRHIDAGFFGCVEIVESYVL